MPSAIIAPGAACGFNVDVQRPVGGLGVEVVHQRQQAGGLPVWRGWHKSNAGSIRLPMFTSMRHQRSEVHARYAGASGVEFFHGA